jgi:GT2 family glycosyltransferase
MSLAIVILNYRTPALTIQCIDSLRPELIDVPDARILLVDNASGDGSMDQIRAATLDLHHRIDFIASDTNLGFAGGNNLALQRLAASDHYVLLLNSDTIVRPGVLRHCLDLMRWNSEVGVLSCRLENLDGTLQENCRRMPTPLRMTAHVLGLDYRYPHAFEWADLEARSVNRLGMADVDWVGGAFMLIRRECLDRVGPLDASFFFYGEDAEFCHRVRRVGYSVRYDGRVGIVHLGGGSSDPQRLHRRSRDRLTWEARYLLQRRCFGLLAEYLLRSLDLATYALRTLKLRLSPTRRDDYDAHRQILSVLLSAPGLRPRAGAALAAGGGISSNQARDNGGGS